MFRGGFRRVIHKDSEKQVATLERIVVRIAADDKAEGLDVTNEKPVTTQPADNNGLEASVALASGVEDNQAALSPPVEDKENKSSPPKKNLSPSESEQPTAEELDVLDIGCEIEIYDDEN